MTAWLRRCMAHSQNNVHSCCLLFSSSSCSAWCHLHAGVIGHRCFL